MSDGLVTLRDWRPVALWASAAWAGAEVTSAPDHPHARLGEALGLDTFPMVAIVPGAFVMGSPDSEPGRRAHERR